MNESINQSNQSNQSINQSLRESLRESLSDKKKLDNIIGILIQKKLRKEMQFIRGKIRAYGTLL